MPFVFVFVIIESIQLWTPMKCVYEESFYETWLNHRKESIMEDYQGKYYQLDMQNITKEQGRINRILEFLTQIALQVILSPHFTLNTLKLEIVVYYECVQIKKDFADFTQPTQAQRKGLSPTSEDRRL